MRPEMPYLATGAVMAVSAARNRAATDVTTRAAIAITVLVILTSATAGTPAAPLVRAVGTLTLAAVIWRTVLNSTKPKRGPSNG